MNSLLGIVCPSVPASSLADFLAQSRVSYGGLPPVSAHGKGSPQGLSLRFELSGDFNSQISGDPQINSLKLTVWDKMMYASTKQAHLLSLPIPAFPLTFLFGHADGYSMFLRHADSLKEEEAEGLADRIQIHQPFLPPSGVFDPAANSAFAVISSPAAQPASFQEMADTIWAQEFLVQWESTVARLDPYHFTFLGEVLMTFDELGHLLQRSRRRTDSHPDEKRWVLRFWMPTRSMLFFRRTIPSSYVELTTKEMCRLTVS